MWTDMELFLVGILKYLFLKKKKKLEVMIETQKIQCYKRLFQLIQLNIWEYILEKYSLFYPRNFDASLFLR